MERYYESSGSFLPKFRVKTNGKDDFFLEDHQLPFICFNGYWVAHVITILLVAVFVLIYFSEFLCIPIRCYILSMFIHFPLLLAFLRMSCESPLLFLVFTVCLLTVLLVSLLDILTILQILKASTFASLAPFPHILRSVPRFLLWFLLFSSTFSC